MKKMEITQAIIDEAKNNKNGWVYAIEGEFTSSQSIPPHAIVGAWKVDGEGELTGNFKPNPNYIPRSDN
jgi:hypothetical protein